MDDPVIDKAFAVWIDGWNDGQFRQLLEMCAQQNAEQIFEAADVLYAIEMEHYAHTDEKLLTEYVYPSIRLFLGIVTNPPEYAMDEEQGVIIDAACYLWGNNHMPIFDGLAWRLHSNERLVSLAVAGTGHNA